MNSIKDALKFHIVYCELRNQKQPLAYSWALMTPPITEFFELLQTSKPVFNRRTFELDRYNMGGR